jgi:3-hydroxybutyryl-CoA dehydrogenase
MTYTIAIIGAGTMGNGIAHTFAQKGYAVALIDTNALALNKGLNTITANLERMVVKAKITPETKAQTLKNISLFSELEAGVSRADIVIEAATEQLEVKLKIFKQLDRVCKPHTILATNTSSLSITQIAAKTTRPEQVIGMHFMNPVPIMPLVEIIRGYNTSKSTLETIITLTKQLDKTPVEANDYPGFIANRILMPMLNEAIYSLYTNVANVKAIDTVMKLGMAHPMGPLQLADFIGLDVCLSILNVMHDGFKDSKYAPCPLLVNMVNAGKLGLKSGEGFYDYSKSKKAEYVSKQFLTPFL